MIFTTVSGQATSKEFTPSRQFDSSIRDYDVRKSRDLGIMNALTLPPSC
jgi:hypothetical protein